MSASLARIALPVVLVAALVAALFVFFGGENPEPQTRPIVAADHSPNSPAQPTATEREDPLPDLDAPGEAIELDADTPLAYRFEPGNRSIHEFEFAQDTSMEIGAAWTGGQAAPPVETRIAMRGRLTVEVLGREGDGAWLSLTLDPLDVERGDGPAQAPHLSAPVLVRIEDTGRMLGFVTPSEWTPEDRGLVRGLHIGFAIVLAGARGETVGTAVEADSTGRFLARYRALAGDDPDAPAIEIRKAFDAYEEKHAGEESPDLEVRHRALARFDREAGCLLSVEIDALVRSAGDPDADPAAGDPADPTSIPMMRSLESHMSGRMTRIDVGEDGRTDEERAEVLAALQAGGRWIESTPSASELAELAEARRTARATARLEGVDLETLLTRLAAVARSDGPLSPDEHRVFLDAAALLRLKADQVDRTLELVSGGTLPERTDAILLGALSGAGTARAEAALVTLASDDAQPADLRSAALNSLGASKAATPASVRFVEETMTGTSEYRDDAILAYGSMTSSVSAADERRANTMARRLNEMLDTAQTDRDRELVIMAMGNARHPDHLDRLRAEAEEGSGAARVRAVEALRQMGEIPEED